MTQETPTRADYMAGRATHREFYAAIVADAGVYFRADAALVQRAKHALAIGDTHLNTIPLALWDRYAEGQRLAVSRALWARGDFWSQAGGVCVCKEAVRQAVERGNAGEGE